MHHMIAEYAQRHGIAATEARAYFDLIQRRAVKTGGVDELLEDTKRIALRMYTTVSDVD